ncbi:hypothetical protein KY285_020198 [Solanum tuberosum]|nr:hypothetical protein KY289_020444 [Solanum tuberosum]KAH0693101.1 hypothetical protein KY285_020198 [Solanum tuberosum]
MKHHHHSIDEVPSSSYHYRHPINKESLSYQWGINIIILSMKHYHHPIDGVASSSYQYHHPTNGSSSLSYQWISVILPMNQHHLTDGSSLSLLIRSNYTSLKKDKRSLSSQEPNL